MSEYTQEMADMPDYSPEVEREHRAWAALHAQADGMDAEGIQLLYGLTLEELTPYEAEWRTLTGQHHA